MTIENVNISKYFNVSFIIKVYILVYKYNFFNNNNTYIRNTLGARSITNNVSAALCINLIYSDLVCVDNEIPILILLHWKTFWKR